MPARSALQRVIRRAFHRWPVTQGAALGALDLFYQAALFPFRRRRLPGSTRESETLLAQTDDFNAAAERYFQHFEARDYLLNKPFSESHQLAKHLVDAGVLIDAMRLRPGDVVLELGAGSCWLSHFLNRFGCRTISLDVSPTVIALGRELFERDPRTRWELDPQFITYDGRTLPLADQSCDRIVINDAFHHIPNQRDLLREMARVLKRDGLVAMSEPGHGHAATPHSLAEHESTGVLENELVIEDVAALATDCGFSRVTVIATSPFVRHEVDAADLGRFMGGKGFTQYWKTLCAALEQHHYILCYKGPGEVTTARPGNLSARIELTRPDLSARTGEAPTVTLRVTNTGNTTWLHAAGADGGWTRAGAHLYRDASPREVLDFDWYRASLPMDVHPGDQVEIAGTLPAISNPGDYVVAFDLVIEGVTWFADRGSSTATLRLRVG